MKNIFSISKRNGIRRGIKEKVCGHYWQLRHGSDVEAAKRIPTILSISHIQIRLPTDISLSQSLSTCTNKTSTRPNFFSLFFFREMKIEKEKEEEKEETARNHDGM